MRLGGPLPPPKNNGTDVTQMRQICCPCRESILCRPVPNLDVVPTMLSRLEVRLRQGKELRNENVKGLESEISCVQRTVVKPGFTANDRNFYINVKKAIFPRVSLHNNFYNKTK
jgi:hypothetical protein